MRILQLRFKNLNSLVGEWAIDFSDRAFTDDGIFAIVGPTGAGKTTLLDAICLALYGRTPRLPKVTQGTNEVMSRRCGDCFAEVSFATLKGHYRCRWDQHRAYKRPMGELQPVRHEFADADSGRVLATGMRPVALKVIATTGMGFDQFTRSVLLAQGDFAAFLNATADERAPILEHITGTEIYSKISIRVHERRSAERSQLDQLQAELKGIALLSEEEVQRFGETLQQHCKDERACSVRLAQQNQALAWVDGITRRQQELDQIEQQQTELERRIKDFASAQEKLNAANRALELAADYAALTALRKQQQTDHDDLAQQQQRLPDNTQEASAASKALAAASEAFATQKTAQQQALPVIRKVRELDLLISATASTLNDATQAIAKRASAIGTLADQQQQNLSECECRRKALSDLQQQLQASEIDCNLVEQLAGIDERCQVLSRDQQKLQAVEAATAVASTHVEEAARCRDLQTATLGTAKKRYLEQQQAAAEKETQHSNMLGGQTLVDWRQQGHALSTEKALLNKALEAHRLRCTAQTALTTLNNKKTEWIAEDAALNHQLSRQVEQQVVLDNKSELLHTQLQLLHKIASLEAHRAQLEDGGQCPLCGARHHPFALGNVPQSDHAAECFATVKADLKRITAAVANTRVESARVSKDLEQQAIDRQQQQDTLEAAKQQLAESGAQLRFGADDPELEAALQQRRDDNHTALLNCNHTVHNAETLKAELDTQHQALAQLKDALVHAEREAQRRTYAFEAADQSYQRRQLEVDALQREQQQKLASCQQAVQAFAVARLTLDTVQQVLQQLAERRMLWLQRQQQRTELIQAIATREAQIAQQSEHLDQAQQALNKQQTDAEALKQRRQQLAVERQRLFSDKQPDAEERRLALAIDNQEQRIVEARRCSVCADQTLAQRQSQIEALQQACAARAAQLKLIAVAFGARLTVAGFSGEDDYCAAVLTEDERKALTQQAQQLNNESAAVRARQREATKLLATERQQQLTDLPRQALAQQVTERIAEQQQLQQCIGGLRQRLQQNAALKQQQQDRLAAITAQQRECERWDLLYQLLGSADGKKYRNFAQGLTFEIMVRHANRQLQQMYDRYLLIRNNEHPLELNVIDNYQAGEVRSTENLSGGESFIVSLSLALGLSSMTSSNIRVDSLFLDEGFGTLDEDMLDTALEALASLRQDGKLIGVISHVLMLKERIPTHIHVIRKSDGHSTINGPGCREYSNPAGIAGRR